MSGQREEIVRGLVLTTLLFCWATTARAELVGHWSLDGTLQNSAQPIPRAAYFLLDEDALTPALDPPTYVAGPSSWPGTQAVALSGPADPEGNGRIDGDLLILYEDELGLAPVAETRDWTLTGWFRVDPQPTFAVVPGSGAAGLFLNGEVESGQQHQFGFGLQSTAASRYGLVYHAEGQADQATVFNELADEVWYFVAQVSNEVDDTLSVYLWSDEQGKSGTLASEVVGTATPLWLERVFEMEIGWDPCCSQRLFDGVIADVRLYDEGLSETQLWELVHMDADLPGDLNGDRVVDAADIDRLSAAIRAGDMDAKYDLNADGQVDPADRSHWVERIVETWFGDSNLDREFNSGDLIDVFQIGLYEDADALNAGWADGDWDGDGDFSTADFVLAFTGGGYEKGPRPSAGVAVPEPDHAWTWGGLCWLLMRRGQRHAGGAWKRPSRAG